MCIRDSYVGALNSSEKHLITQARANASYAAPGYLLFYRDQTLFAQRFDAKKLELSGEPTPVLTELEYLPRIQRAVFASSDSGVLVCLLYTSQPILRNIAIRSPRKRAFSPQ